MKECVSWVYEGRIFDDNYGNCYLMESVDQVCIIPRDVSISTTGHRLYTGVMPKMGKLYCRLDREKKKEPCRGISIFFLGGHETSLRNTANTEHHVECQRYPHTAVSLDQSLVVIDRWIHSVQGKGVSGPGAESESLEVCQQV